MRLSRGQIDRLTTAVVSHLTDPTRQRQAGTWHKRVVDRRHEGFVYIIRATANGDIKIGFTRNVPARINDLRTAHSRPVELLLVLRGGEELERALYIRFAAHQIKGEWFAPADDLANWIAVVQARFATRAAR